MPIRVCCSTCARTFRISDKYAGRRIRCPQCKGAIGVPEPEAEESSFGAFLDAAVESERASYSVAAEPNEERSAAPVPSYLIDAAGRTDRERAFLSKSPMDLTRYWIPIALSIGGIAVFWFVAERLQIPRAPALRMNGLLLLLSIPLDLLVLSILQLHFQTGFELGPYTVRSVAIRIAEVATGLATLDVMTPEWAEPTATAAVLAWLVRFLARVTLVKWLFELDDLEMMAYLFISFLMGLVIFMIVVGHLAA